MKFILSILLCAISLPVFAGWNVSQTTIEHVQIGNANVMYISFSSEANTLALSCSESPFTNWAALPLDSTDPKVNALISLALSAQAQNIKVDLGGPATCELSAYPTLQYIRVGKLVPGKRQS